MRHMHPSGLRVADQITQILILALSPHLRPRTAEEIVNHYKKG